MSKTNRHSYLLGVTEASYKEILAGKIVLRDLSSGDTHSIDVLEGRDVIDQVNEFNSVVIEIKDRRFTTGKLDKFLIWTLAANVPCWTRMKIMKRNRDLIDHLIDSLTFRQFMTYMEETCQGTKKVSEKLVTNLVQALENMASWTDLKKAIKTPIKAMVQEYENVIKMGQGTTAEYSKPQEESLEQEWFDDGNNDFCQRGIDNARTNNYSGSFDKEVCSKPLYKSNKHVAEMGTRYRPLVERTKDLVPFWKFYKYIAPEVEADLEAELRLEALFQERSHSLALHLKQRARRYLQKFDMRLFTREEQRQMIAYACSIAMTVDSVEEKCKSIVSRNKQAMKQSNKFWKKFQDP